MQAAMAARTAPRKMQPIAIPTFWPRESPGLSFDEGKAVCTRMVDVGIVAMVGEDKLLAVDLCDDNVAFGGIAVNDGSEVVKADEVAADSVEDCSCETLSERDAFKNIVTPSASLKAIAVGVGIGIVDDARFALRCKVTDEIWLEARTHGGSNSHVGVYITEVVVGIELVISLAC
jgi:hypothetical protein